MGIIISCIVGALACIADAICSIGAVIVGCVECVFAAIVEGIAAVIACLTCGLCCAAVI